MNTVENSREYLAATIDQPIKLADAAEIACFSPFHYQRVFRRQYGMTPNEFRRRLRLESALRLLASDHMSVGEITMAVGYASQGSFTTLFSQRYGMTPLEFRRGVRRLYQLSGYQERFYVPLCHFLRT